MKLAFSRPWHKLVNRKVGGEFTTVRLHTARMDRWIEDNHPSSAYWHTIKPANVWVGKRGHKHTLLGTAKLLGRADRCLCNDDFFTADFCRADADCTAEEFAELMHGYYGDSDHRLLTILTFRWETVTDADVVAACAAWTKGADDGDEG